MQRRRLTIMSDSKYADGFEKMSILAGNEVDDDDDPTAAKIPPQKNVVGATSSSRPHVHMLPYFGMLTLYVTLMCAEEMDIIFCLITAVSQFFFCYAGQRIFRRM